MGALGLVLLAAVFCGVGARGAACPAGLTQPFVGSAADGRSLLLCPAAGDGADVTLGALGEAARRVAELERAAAAGPFDGCCYFQRLNASAVSGVYEVPHTGDRVFCEFLGPGLCFLLVSSFEKNHNGAPVPTAVADTYFRTPPSWILGNTMGPPVSPNPANVTNFSVLGLPWTRFLRAERPMRLRQRCAWHATTGQVQAFDVSYAFDWLPSWSVVAQDAGDALAQRAWPLRDRILHESSLPGITWHTPPGEVARFYPPYTVAVKGTVINGAGGATTATNPTFGYGSAGIIGQSADRLDPALSWAPFVYIIGATTSESVCFAHQLQDNPTAGPGGIITKNSILTYWLG